MDLLQNIETFPLSMNVGEHDILGAVLSRTERRGAFISAKSFDISHALAVKIFSTMSEESLEVVSTTPPVPSAIASISEPAPGALRARIFNEE